MGGGFAARATARRLGAVVLAVTLGWASPSLAQSCGAGETAESFSFTGSDQTIAVPPRVHSATIHLRGAQGGNGKNGTDAANPGLGGTGGHGAEVSGTLAVSPGDVLSIGVGGRGSLAVNPGGASATPDGGNGGGGTDLRLNSSPVAMAGGGGGGGNAGSYPNNPVAGGAGGDSGGGGSSGADIPGNGPYGGQGGTPGAGGAAGAGCGRFPGTNGSSSGQGGAAVTFTSFGSFPGAGSGGGGGGGSMVGGGGGGAGVGTTSCSANWNGGGGGGAGGTSSSGSLQSASVSEGANSGDGSALVCFGPPLYTISGTATGQTGAVDLQLTSPAGNQTVNVASGAASFAFATGLPDGASWSVAVQSEPAGQICKVTPSSGTISGADVTDLALVCTTVTVQLAPTALPDGTGGVAYSQTITASSTDGGTAPYTFLVTSGTLPAGLVLSSGGVLAGTTVATGSFTFTVEATSSNGFKGSQAYTLAIAAPAITVDPATLADGVGSNSYGPVTVSATGGTAPYTYGVTGALPAGVTLVGDQISGTPTATGTFNVTVTATDAHGFTGARAYTFAITAPGITVEPDSLANGNLFDSYGPVPLSADGGTAPYTYAVTAGALPNGLTVSNGQISGTPTQFGTFTFTVTATDHNSFTGDRDYTLVVDRTLPEAQDHTLSLLAGTSGTVDLTQGALNGPFTDAAIVSPPASEAGVASIVHENNTYVLHFAASATYAGTTSLTYTLSNSDGVSEPATVTITVTARPDPSLDPEVVGLVRAQTEQARHFADNQIRSFGQRLEQLHNEGEQRENSINVGVSVDGASNGDDCGPQGNGQRKGPGQPVPDGACVLQSTDAGYGMPSQLPRGQLPSGQPPSQVDATEASKTTASAGYPSTGGGATASIPTGSGSPGTGNGSTAYQSGPAANPFGELAFWSGGYVNFGTNDDGAIKLDHTLVGLSAGADYRFSPTFTAGLGLGYGHDVTDVGSNGTESRAQAISVAAYGSYRPTPGIFLDGLAGYSALSFDSLRYVTATGDFASGSRDGNQVFASLTAGYEFRRTGSLMSPYGRLSGSHSMLDGFTETGGDIYNLTYGEQTVDTLSGTLGLRLENTVPTDWGVLTPRARFEYTHDFSGSSRASLGYADIGTMPYTLDADAFATDYLSIGLGVDARIGGVTFGLNYSTAVGTSGASQDHTIAARLGMKL
ncbi:autotransporter outer membrane beta-barrel domain-containing protein [Mesorhizobium comanense]|uniref:autotransporter outer membrane beta-barrel domain-containing protein n=1 Tax=Mesorhizobium comanense TaxID=2502215 RepID=UPI0010F78801|nr:autotransporter outer membrane beta-barrel domain-containing protein [Mesorhizobium comanense]